MSEDTYMNTLISGYAGGAHDDGMYAWLEVVEEEFTSEDDSAEMPIASKTIRFIRSDIYQNALDEIDRLKGELVETQEKTHYWFGRAESAELDRDRYRQVLKNILYQRTEVEYIFTAVKEALGDDNGST